MFFKLARHSVYCQMVKIIKSMYANINLCVRYKNQMSEIIICQLGLMQGEYLSLLFFLVCTDFIIDLIKKCVKFRDNALVFCLLCMKTTP